MSINCWTTISVFNRCCELQHWLGRDCWALPSMWFTFLEKRDPKPQEILSSSAAMIFQILGIKFHLVQWASGSLFTGGRKAGRRRKICRGTISIWNCKPLSDMPLDILGIESCSCTRTQSWPPRILSLPIKDSDHASPNYTNAVKEKRKRKRTCEKSLPQSSIMDVPRTERKAA